MSKLNRGWTCGILYFLYFASRWVGLSNLKYNVKTNTLKQSKFFSLYGVLLIISSFILIPKNGIEMLSITHAFDIFPFTLAELSQSMSTLRTIIIHFVIHLSLKYYQEELLKVLNEGISLYNDIIDVTGLDFFSCDNKFLVQIIMKLVINAMPGFALMINFLKFSKFYNLQGIMFAKDMFIWSTIFIAMINNSFTTSIYISVLLYGAHLYRLVNSRIRNVVEQLKSNQKISISHCCKLSDEIDMLNSLYTRITAFVQELNRLFSPLLMAYFVCNFIAAVFEMFYLYMTVVVSDIPFEKDLEQNFADIAFVLSTALQNLFLIYAGNKISRRSKKTGRLLCVCTQQDLDERLEKSLEIFAIQLFHQKMEISIYDLFKVDYSLLFAMSGAITGYLIILVQFQLTGDEGNIFNPIA